jgi:hypothetical protein
LTIQNFKGGYELNPVWVEIAESLKFLDENRLKLAKLEADLEQMTKDIERQDLIDFECKLAEYRNLL